MHPAPHFHDADAERLSALFHAHPLALVVAVDDDGRPRVAHAPVLADPDGRRLRFHLSRRNPAAAAVRARGSALLVATGPDAYVSPDWYDVREEVPTWNYLSAEAEGPVTHLDEAGALQLLDDLSARFEAELAPKPPWTRDKVPEPKLAAQLRAIDAFAMTPERLEGVRKLSQNRTAAGRAGIIDALVARGRPHDEAIAALIAALDGQKDAAT